MERRPQSRHGRLSRITAVVKEQLRDWVREQPDRTLAELGEQLHARGIAVSRSRVSQILHQMGLGLKKSRSMPLSGTRKPTASAGRNSSPPSPRSAGKLKFLDESGVTTQMTRLWGRAPRGERVTEATPDGRWQVLTTLGTMSLRGMDAVMTVPAATDGDVFRAYVEQVLCATLRPGDVLILDNLSAHKVAGIRELIEACGAQLLYLPPSRRTLIPSRKPGPSSSSACVPPELVPPRPWTKPSQLPSKPSLPITPPHGSVIAGTKVQQLWSRSKW